ncbi:MAG TPA: hypothetical protein VGH10_08040 [Actinomycetota bacterium]
MSEEPEGALVRFWRGEPPNPMAAMIGGLLEANLRAHPERASLLDRPGTVAVLATDVEVGVTVRMGGGRAIVRNGVIGRPDAVVRAPSSDLMSLSKVPTRFGIPDVSKPEARELVRKIATRKLRIAGVVLGGAQLARFSKLLDAP